jgi:tetratricopeptide (TPR) repeat protein
LANFCGQIAGKDFEEGEPVSLQEIDDFIKWAKAQPFEIADHIFAFRKGATYYAFEHDQEAVKAYEEAQQHPQAVWSVNYGLLLAYERLKDYPAALKYIQKLKTLSDQFLATDKKFKTVWWDVLLSEGNCYRRCQNCEPAAECFRAILDQKVDDEFWPGRVHTEALSALFTTWAEMKNYRSIIDHVRSWRDTKDKTRDASYWFQKTIWAEKVHGCIIAAAKRNEAIDDVCSLYQEVIDKLPSSIPAPSEEENGPDPSAKGQLQYFQAALRFHGSRVDQKQDHGIQAWEDIVQRSEEPTSFWWAAMDATRRLAPALLDKALVNVTSPLPDISKSYDSRLMMLAKMNNTVIRYVRQGQKDPRLCVIRLQHLKDNSESAFTEARDRLISVFDNWPNDENDDSVELRIKNLAQTLTVLDRDTDAVAAWQMTKPRKQRAASTVDVASSKDTDSTKSDPCSTQLDSTPAVAVGKTEDDQKTPTSATVMPRAYISQYFCDAACGTTWKTMLADCYVCKHCLCVQLCSGCYKKLQDDDLDPLICNKNHQMLYLPAFDQAAWHNLPPDAVILDRKPASRAEWLNGIKDEFKVQQEQIDVLKIERVREITSWTSMAVMWRRWRNRVLKNRPKETPVAPTIRRVQTAK